MSQRQRVVAVHKNRGMSTYKQGKWTPGHHVELACGHVITRHTDTPDALPAEFPCRKCELAGKTKPGVAPTHSELCAIAERWLRNTKGCGAVLVEKSDGYQIPDAIGWKGGDSHLVECKTSTSDFRVDLKKHGRQDSAEAMGVGILRWYLAAPGIVPVADLPPRWGLLVWDGSRVHEVRAPDRLHLSFGQQRHEILLLSSALRMAQDSVTGTPSPSQAE